MSETLAQQIVAGMSEDDKCRFLNDPESWEDGVSMMVEEGGDIDEVMQEIEALIRQVGLVAYMVVEAECGCQKWVEKRVSQEDGEDAEADGCTRHATALEGAPVAQCAFRLDGEVHRDLGEGFLAPLAATVFVEQ